LLKLPGERVDFEPTLYRLRRRKDAHELARIRKAIAGTRRMYEVARQIIEPGISEIEVFNRLQAAAVEEFGEMLTGTGNDYQCGARGGPPRDGRLAQDGELYILDLGPAFRGYFADNSRAIAVNRRPTDEQQEARRHVLRVFDHVEKTVKPGKSCQELFHEAQTILNEAPVGVFNHHLGHGIGLFPHEGPHLNPHWDDTFEVGDVFTCEPGLYDEAVLRAGMRLENDYLVTETGVENLSPFPMEL
jgi:Xaa-Pro dipeptidase